MRLFDDTSFDKMLVVGCGNQYRCGYAHDKKTAITVDIDQSKRPDIVADSTLLDLTFVPAVGFSAIVFEHLPFYIRRETSVNVLPYLADNGLVIIMGATAADVIDGHRFRFSAMMTDDLASGVFSKMLVLYKGSVQEAKRAAKSHVGVSAYLAGAGVSDIDTMRVVSRDFLTRLTTVAGRDADFGQQDCLLLVNLAQRADTASIGGDASLRYHHVVALIAQYGKANFIKAKLSHLDEMIGELKALVVDKDVSAALTDAEKHDLRFLAERYNNMVTTLGLFSGVRKALCAEIKAALYLDAHPELMTRPSAAIDIVADDGVDHGDPEAKAADDEAALRHGS